MLPENGLPAAGLLARIAELRAADLPVRGGRTTAYVYDAGRPDVQEVAHAAYAQLLEVNGLDPTAFPSVVELEKEVVAAVAGRLGGGHGIFTNGGTESILLAVKAARDAKAVRDEQAAHDVAPAGAGRGRANLVVPNTAHAAFHKAAHYLGMEIVAVPVDPVTFRADPAAMAAAVTEDTALIVASAPSYAHGVLDPVREIAALAAERGVPCHVDACIGGWLLPWLPEPPDFDLSVPGVTSLSVDLHKYGYAPKGASVLLFRDQALRRSAYYACATWPGYTVINSTIQSTKGAGPLAGAWATLNALGAQGYRDLAEQTWQATRRLIDGIADIPGLRVLGEPDASLVAVASTDPDLDVFALSDEARERGWFLQPQLSYAGMPANVHMTITGVSLAAVGELLTVIAESAKAARASGPPPVPDGLPELLADLDLDTVDDAGFAELLGAVGVDLDGGPVRMGVVNTVLDSLPAELREALIIRFLAVLY